MTKNPLVAYGTWLAGTGHEWPEDAVESAHREFIDQIAVSIAGTTEPAARKVMNVVSHWGRGASTVIGSIDRLAAPWAALVNGTAGHALDYDDNFDPPKAHATTVLAPSILALGEQEGLSGQACLDAYICGLQIMGRVGQGLNPVHRNRGWHATATLGAVGAAAACARLLGLDAGTSARALSIATSMSAGFMSQFGTMTKPLHAGLAAKAGVMASCLAREGISAGMKTLDGVHGMNRLMVGPDLDELRAGLEHFDHGQTLEFETDRVGEPLLITEHGFRVKRFANCGSAHRSMDALLALIEENEFETEDIERIDVRAPEVHLNNLMHTDPVNGLEAKFSLEYALAVLLVRGKCTLRDFDDEAVRRPEVRSLFSIIHRHPVGGLEGETPTEVTISLKDGRTLSCVREWPEGSKASPFPTSQYWQKFDECCEGIVGEDQKAAIREPLEKLPALGDIGDLMKPLCFEPIAEEKIRAEHV